MYANIWLNKRWLGLNLKLDFFKLSWFFTFCLYFTIFRRYIYIPWTILLYNIFHPLCYLFIFFSTWFDISYHFGHIQNAPLVLSIIWLSNFQTTHTYCSKSIYIMWWIFPYFHRFFNVYVFKVSRHNPLSQAHFFGFEAKPKH
jgi:hypothetical protein